jgi:hypothetical protein
MMQKRIDIRAKTAFYAFDSLAELGRYIDDTPATWHIGHSNEYGPSANWDLNAGYRGAVRMAKEGWPEGARRAQQALKAFVPKTPSLALRTDFYGHMPHVPRYCAGAPDNMIRHHKEPTIGGGRVLTLYVPVNASGHTDAQSMANYGVAVAQYIQQLEADGLRVELYGLSCQQGTTGAAKGWVLSFSWLLKRADQPLDLAVVTFGIGHPAMLRRLSFALSERSASPEMSSYGNPLRATKAQLINPVNGAVILNGMADAYRYADTPENALDHITKEIDAAIEAQLEGVI